MADHNSSVSESSRKNPRSLPINQWPDADQLAWEDACRLSSRLKPGGTASHLAEITRESMAWRYGAFLGFLQQYNRLACDATAASQVTPSNVEAYIADLTSCVSSVTIYGYIHGLRRVAELFVPIRDFSWLTEIEKDLKSVMEPRSKYRNVWFDDYR